MIVKCKHHKWLGFTLLEVLVAFVIAAVALTLLIRAFSGGLRLTATAEDYGKATILAQSLMAQVGVEYGVKDSPISGRFADRFDWAVNMTPYMIDVELLDEEPVVMAFKCVISITWFEGIKKRHYELSNLRLMEKEQNNVNG